MRSLNIKKKQTAHAINTFLQTRFIFSKLIKPGTKNLSGFSIPNFLLVNWSKMTTTWQYHKHFYMFKVSNPPL